MFVCFLQFRFLNNLIQHKKYVFVSFQDNFICILSLKKNKLLNSL